MRIVPADEQITGAGAPAKEDSGAGTGTATGPRVGAPPPRRFLTALLLAPLVTALALWAFAWPAARTAPHDLPLGVAGPDTAVTQIEARLSGHKGAFELHRYSGEPAARAAIEARDVYGAVVVTGQGTTLLTASAASPLVAQFLHQAVAQSGDVRTVDVVAAPATDPRGAALTASVLPLAMAG
ncbi:ABC transporter permease, partial [Streptomyces sp. S6]